MIFPICFERPVKIRSTRAMCQDKNTIREQIKHFRGCRKRSLSRGGTKYPVSTGMSEKGRDRGELLRRTSFLRKRTHVSSSQKQYGESHMHRQTMREASASVVGVVLTEPVGASAVGKFYVAAAIGYLCLPDFQ